MFIVKHIDVNGAERLYEAEKVEYLRTGNRFVDGIFLDPGEDNGGNTQTGGAQGAPTRTFKHVIHFEDCQNTSGVSPVVYVMNRFGSTVATYRL